MAAALFIGAVLYAVAGYISLVLLLLFGVGPGLLLRLCDTFPMRRHRITIVVAVTLIAVHIGLLTYWTDPSAPSVFLVAVGLLICSFSIVALCSDRLFRRFKFPSLIAAAVVAFFVSSAVVYVVFGPLLPYAGMTCSEYRLLARVGGDGDVHAQHRLTLSMEWQDNRDIKRNVNGDIERWQNQTAIAEYLKSEGYHDWDIADIQIAPTIEQGKYNVTARLEKSERNISKRKKGWIRYLVEIYTNKHVYGYGSGRAQSVVLIIEMPKGFSLNHNLEGEFSASVLDDGTVGQRLVADKIVSYGGHTVMLSFISPQFQNPALNWLGGFSAWTIFAFLGSLLLGVTGYCVGVFLDVFKDESMKPLAKTVLTRIGLVPIIDEDAATSSGK